MENSLYLYIYILFPRDLLKQFQFFFFYKFFWHYYISQISIVLFSWKTNYFLITLIKKNYSYRCVIASSFIFIYCERSFYNSATTKTILKILEIASLVNEIKVLQHQLFTTGYHVIAPLSEFFMLFKERRKDYKH